VDDRNNTNHQKVEVTEEEVLRSSHLCVHFPIRKGLLKREIGCVKAVQDVSFTLNKGQTLALVGESGCGKTTLSRAICQLLPKTSGDIYLYQAPLLEHSTNLASTLQIVFQDPFSSMNPRMLIQDILMEGVIAQGQGPSLKEQEILVKELLNMVGLPRTAGIKYPHEFSGGQRQRISIARALAVKPSILICDEPTSALDVSVQAQILNLLLSLQQELGLSYLFISHDLSVVSYMADHIMVMQQGKIVEQGQAQEVLKFPKKSYTKALLSASTF
jgi:peptide/nickel transport system ATP-binding protein